MSTHFESEFSTAISPVAQPLPQPATAITLEKYVIGQAAIEAALRGLELEQDTELLSALKQKFGYDVKFPKSKLPITTMVAIAEHLWQNYYRHLNRERAMFEIGRKSMWGYRRTFLGRVALVALPLVPVERAMQKLPSLMSSNVNYGKRRIEKQAAAHWEMFFEEDPGDPYATAGMLMGILEMLRLPFPQATPFLLANQKPENLCKNYKVVMTWDNPNQERKLRW